MKILSIGNSFSCDAQAFLHDLAEQRGIDLKAVNLAIGGCSLETHINNIRENKPNYLLMINGEENWEADTVAVEPVIKGEKFDIVTVQQVSHLSGIYETYQPYLNDLIEYIKKMQPNAKIYFHKTWAYEIDSKHGQYSLYENSQEKMYEAICKTSEIVAKEIGADVISSGDVIQALRKRVPEFDYGNGGMTLCLDDGFHMSHTYGRYAVALTWLATLTGIKAEPMEYKDLDINLISEICKIVNEIVHK